MPLTRRLDSLCANGSRHSCVWPRSSRAHAQWRQGCDFCADSHVHNAVTESAASALSPTQPLNTSLSADPCAPQRSLTTAARCADVARGVQHNWSDVWGPTYACPMLEHIGEVGDGGKWVCGVDQLLQRCAAQSPTRATPRRTVGPQPQHSTRARHDQIGRILSLAFCTFCTICAFRAGRAA